MSSAPSEDCMAWVMSAINGTNLFGDKLFRVYDPAILQEIASRLNYPVCGVLYEGIHPEGTEDQGVSTMLSVGVIVLAESRERDITQNVDESDIAVMLDTLRTAILRKTSPTNHPWLMGIEVPMDLGDRGLVYYQNWKTVVIL